MQVVSLCCIFFTTVVQSTKKTVFILLMPICYSHTSTNPAFSHGKELIHGNVFITDT